MAVVEQPRCLRGLDQQADAVLLDGVQIPKSRLCPKEVRRRQGFGRSLLIAPAWSPKVLRSGMGAHFQLDNEQCDLLGFLAGYQGQSVSTQS